MKKRIVWLLTAALCTSGATLAACGQQQSKPDDAAATTAVEQPKKEVDPSEKFVGDWKLACLETRGVTVTGDYSQMLGTDAENSLKINEDGTGTLKFGEHSGDITWKLADDDNNTIVLTPKAQEDSQSGTDATGQPSTLNVTYDADKKTLGLTMSDDEFQGTMVFSTDGTVEGLPTADISKATAVKSKDAIVGDWKVCAVGMNGALMSGDPESLAVIFGSSFDASLSIAADGTIKMGEDATGTLEEGEDGVVLKDTYTTMLLKTLDDKLVLDLSEIMGAEMFILYTK